MCSAPRQSLSNGIFLSIHRNSCSKTWFRSLLVLLGKNKFSQTTSVLINSYDTLRILLFEDLDFIIVVLDPEINFLFFKNFYNPEFLPFFLAKFFSWSPKILQNFSLKFQIFSQFCWALKECLIFTKNFFLAQQRLS